MKHSNFYYLMYILYVATFSQVIVNFHCMFFNITFTIIAKFHRLDIFMEIEEAQPWPNSLLVISFTFKYCECKQMFTKMYSFKLHSPKI